MTLPRRNEFSNRDLKLADFAKALSHPARVAILKALAEKRECICDELVLNLPLAQSTVSQHLKVLKELGLIKGVLDGPKSRYCIDWKVFESFERHRREWSEKILQLKAETCC